LFTSIRFASAVCSTIHSPPSTFNCSGVRSSSHNLHTFFQPIFRHLLKAAFNPFNRKQGHLFTGCCPNYFSMNRKQVLFIAARSPGLRSSDRRPLLSLLPPLSTAHSPPSPFSCSGVRSLMSQCVQGCMRLCVRVGPFHPPPRTFIPDCYSCSVTCDSCLGTADWQSVTSIPNFSFIILNSIFYILTKDLPQEVSYVLK
jgi:hypothetical protein